MDARATPAAATASTRGAAAAPPRPHLAVPAVSAGFRPPPGLEPPRFPPGFFWAAGPGVAAPGPARGGAGGGAGAGALRLLPPPGLPAPGAAGDEDAAAEEGSACGSDCSTADTAEEVAEEALGDHSKMPGYIVGKVLKSEATAAGFPEKTSYVPGQVLKSEAARAKKSVVVLELAASVPPPPSAPASPAATATAARTRTHRPRGCCDCSAEEQPPREARAPVAAAAPAGAPRRPATREGPPGTWTQEPAALEPVPEEKPEEKPSQQPRHIATTAAADPCGPGVPSVGSEGHAEGRCTPCDFVHRKTCRAGADCVFCHLCGPRESKLRKKARQEFLKQARKLNAQQARAAEEALEGQAVVGGA